MPAPHPAYADLTPDGVLDALDAVGFRGDGRILQLNSYENRVFQVMLEGGDAVVAKFYRPRRWTNEQIVEEHAFAIELADAEVPVVAPLVLRSHAAGVMCLPEGAAPTLALRRSSATLHRWSVSPRRSGRAPELEDPQVLRRLGGFIGRLHAVGARNPFAHRRRLDAPRDLRAAMDRLDAGDFVPAERRDEWRDACAEALRVVDSACTAVRTRDIRLHGDCHVGNLLWRDEGAHVVDLDDACTGPAVQDLWMLLAGDPDAMARQLRALLEGYEAFRDFDRSELLLVEPLRLLRMVRHNAWIAERWIDPAFPAAFPDFGSSSWWGQQAVQLREQTRLAAETPALDRLL